jgi:hypothetical protein
MDLRAPGVSGRPETGCKSLLKRMGRVGGDVILAEEWNVARTRSGKDEPRAVVVSCSDTDS